MTAFYLLDHPNPNAPVRANGLRGWYYPTRTYSPRAITCHTPEAAEDFTGADPTAENVASYLAGVDRPASVHACIDADSIQPCLPDTFTAFGAAGVNSRVVHAEIAWKATSWDRAPAARVQQVLDQCAQWMAPRVLAYQLDLRLIRDRDDWEAGGRGFLRHMDTENWYGTPGRRSDPGNLPWDDLFEAITKEIGMTAEHPPADMNAYVTGHQVGGTLPSWAKKAWAWYQEHKGTTLPDSWGWPTTRADLAHATMTTVEPLEEALALQAAQLETLNERVTALESSPGGVTPGLEGLAERVTKLETSTRVAGKALQG